VTCAGDEPCVYFLTLTPHREPTHTFYDEQGKRLPPRTGTVTLTWQGEPSLDEAAKQDSAGRDAARG